MLNSMVANAPVFLLVAVRCFALIMTLPLFSTRSVPRIAKVTLAAYLAYLIFPQISLTNGMYAPYADFITPEGAFNLEYVLLLLGEGIIGIIIGFFISLIFAVFSTAGQFFAFQMGFAASEVYDSLSQVENPLMGQFLNLIAMLIFMQNHWFQTLFSGGLASSFDSLNAFSIVVHNKDLAVFMVSGLTSLFRDALIIALPLMGTLFLINVTMGILSKAAPQMNLLAEGFPILILTAFLVLATVLPQFIDFFIESFRQGFRELGRLFMILGPGGSL
ncbi:MAG: flagellar biosynthetic protein FliR [Treponema sp.]|nr:flagellar biosynthetic protein FliR [Treponema sp.]